MRLWESRTANMESQPVTTSSTVQRIYHCKGPSNNPHPVVAYRYDFRLERKWDNWDLITAKCLEAHWYVLRDNEDEIEIGTPEVIICSQCLQQMIEGDVHAIVSDNPRHHCDSRCEFAIGPLCVCSCGGPNHGKGWIRGWFSNGS